MALALLSMDWSETETRYRLMLDRGNMNAIRGTFGERQKVLPFLFVNQEERSSLPSDLIRLGTAEINDVQRAEIETFVTRKGRTNTLYVWPRPVEIEGHSLMLLYMWDFDMSECETEEEREALVAVKKALHCLAAITACCVLGFERSSQRKGKSLLCSVFQTIRDTAHFHCVPLLSTDLRTGLISLLQLDGSESPFSGAMCNGTALLRELFSRDVFRGFLECVHSLHTPLSTKTAIHSLLRTLKVCIKLANMNFTYDTFLRCLLNLLFN